MKKKFLGGIALLAIAAVAAWNVNLNSQSNELSGAMLMNAEALANENGGTTHSLNCGSAGIKACSATCSIHQVTLTNYGNGGSSTFTCN
jgi:hypothetical protein